MEEKKLLRRNWLLILLCFFSPNIWAEEHFLDKIMQKYNVMKEEKKHQRYIFISFSMTDENLRRLARNAEDDIIFVLKGLIKTDNPKEAITKTYMKIASIFGDRRVDIDPELFEALDVKVVPVFAIVEENVMCVEQSCIKRFDKLSGNVTYDYAWEKMKDEGEYGKHIKVKGK